MLGAAFTVRFLKNGDTITINKDINKANGEGAALFQMIDTTSGSVAPDWSKAENQPIVTLYGRSAQGYLVAMTAATFAYEGQTLAFTGINSSGWTAETNGKPFSAMFVDDTKGNHTAVKLRITGNLAAKEKLGNRQIDYSLDLVCAAHKETQGGSISVLVQASGANSHLLQITTTRVELDATNTSTMLKTECYYSTNKVTPGSNGYVLKWYKGSTYLDGHDNNNLTVTRDDVNGGNIYIAKLLLNGAVVAQDQQRINDIADEYQIVATPVSGKSVCTPETDAVYTLSFTRNGTEIKNGISSIDWTIYNAKGDKKTSGTTSTVTITKADCNIGGDEYCDVDVDVQVELS